jgi:hypothetical protein
MRLPHDAFAESHYRLPAIALWNANMATLDEILARTKKYADSHYERMAEAIGVLPARVRSYALRFEAAGLQYRLAQRKRHGGKLSEALAELLRIRDAADRLSAHLSVDELLGAADGKLADVCAFLIEAKPGSTEDDLRTAADRLERLIEIFDAALAASDLRERAHLGADDVVAFRKLTQKNPKKQHRHERNSALNDWINAMRRIYDKFKSGSHGITAKAAGRGRAHGLIDFLRIAGAPSAPSRSGAGEAFVQRTRLFLARLQWCQLFRPDRRRRHGRRLPCPALPPTRP